MKPYYEDALVTIWNEDATEWVPEAGNDMPEAVVTDPPYGVNARQRDHGGMGGPVLAWDSEYPHAFINDLATDLPVIAFGSASTIARELATFTPTPRVAVWAPTFRLGMIAKDGMAYRWHPIYVFGVVNEGPTVRDVFTTPTESSHWWNHPATKPLGLMRDLVALTKGVVFDPFMGSGTTLVAAKSLGRKAIGIEIEERYCEIAARRCSQEVLGLVG